MITDRDITKLATVFVTKEDLGALATKKDVGALATEVKSLKASVGGVELRMSYLENRMDSLEDKVDVMDEKLDGALGFVSGIAEQYDSLRTDSAAGDYILSRHTRQIGALAETTGIKLPD